ncbi:hypothetical protein BsWGS_26862 [Bradybaena similaris]
MAGKGILFVCFICITTEIAIKMAAGQEAAGNQSNRLLTFGVSFKLVFDNKHINISVDNNDENLLTGFIGHDKNTQGRVSCQSNEAGYCFQWGNGPRLEIYEANHSARNTSGIQCLTVNWTIPVEAGYVTDTPEDCYSMESFFWFGGFEKTGQPWPLNEFKIASVPFVTSEGYTNLDFGSVIEGLFISSSGTGIYVHETTPLYLSINNNNSKLLCLKGKVGPDTPFFQIDSPYLIYDVCRSSDVTTLWKGMAEEYIPKPSSFPAPEIIRNPIWCTWAAFKANINQNIVLNYAESIKRYNFSISQLEIDDEWTPHFGDFTFVTKTFPNAKEMIANLTRLGIPATVWIHWFFNNDSQVYGELAKSGYLIKRYGSDEPLLVPWWNGLNAGVLDFTNPAATQWYLGRMADLRKNYNVTSFKFDAGEVKWVQNYRYSVYRKMLNPNFLSKKYAEITHQADVAGNRQELRVGFRSQASSNMVRMYDRNSDWSHSLGIKTLIPCSLVFGLMGYPFILSDLIGGNAYSTPVPEPELFVRWLQVSVFLPILQFSIAPWVYNNNTIIAITHKFVDLHEKYADKIIDLAKNAQKTGEPIVRPLWWIAPKDVNALNIDSEFLLGDDLLVAPVLEKGARSRDIYLPAGQWRDELRGVIRPGGAWLRKYAAALDELPYFTKI